MVISFAKKILASVILCGIAAGAQAQGYPNRPITFIVPVTAGTATDVLARLVAAHVGKSLGQTIVIDNRAGASGNIGVEAVAKAAPDGYTVLITTINMSMAPSLFKNLSWNPARDLAPVAMLAELPLALSVNSAVPVNSVAELIALAKKEPGKLNYATPGSATPHHFGMELLKQSTGIDALHVPYKGTGGALIDLAAGRVQIGYFSISNIMSSVKSGKVKVLATASEKRLPWTPNAPTLREQGLRNAEIVPWVGMFVPAGTAPASIKLLERTVIEAMKTPEVAELMNVQGMVATPLPAEQMGAVLKTELARWPQVVSSAGISAE